MNLQEILEHRRAVRYYDASKPIDADRVEACVRLATLAPTSSNMQLWEAYHVTDRATIERLVPACMDQAAVKTAQQLVVFVVRPDLWKDHAEKVLSGAVENIRKTYPQEKWEKYAGLQQAYYRKICPFLYSRGFGVWGLCRKLISCVVGCFRPMPREVTESAMLAVLHKSCALAVQTFMLAMSEAGYDTCPLEGFDSARVKKVLGLPRAARVNMIVSCGIRDEARLLGERVRLPFEEQYHRL